MLHIGLVINPLAGLGGRLAMKGSDGDELRALVKQLSPADACRAQERTTRALRIVANATASIRFSCWAGAMGADVLEQLNIRATVLGRASEGLTSSRDTTEAVRALVAVGMDLILFAGGDGTARDIYDVVGMQCPVLGIPAGVKMQSGVFAVSPEAAGELLLRLAAGGLVGIRAQEVRDIDEQGCRAGLVRSRFYGELMVPSEGHYLQHTKVGGREDPQLAVADIAAWQVSTMMTGCTYLIGPGTTTAAIMAELELDNTLLGVDVVRDGKLLAADVNEEQVLRLLADTPGPARIVVTATGGQGYIFGRGNQQISPAVIRAVGPDNIIIVAAKAKIAALQGRPLLVDTNDVELDGELCGYKAVNTGYDDHLLYRISRQ